MTVFARLILPTLDLEAGPLACPICKQVDGLVVSVDVEDRSETPAFMSCDTGHRWADAQMTRGLAVEIFELMKDKYPETLELSVIE
ncbi:hypothetical protein GFH48_12730 [Streptomyces fagopyri]|uniref:Uncharacterized protein n=1 Tax=Streptomyces fagopyri TaxID=2662397 RepID=A0A5Q0LAX7_9ACTN|nr:hypothetical protein [Streptomyces fagopyri]QFZ73994.1 hypothetical protein GFH48_12730 [Streptomyces fagopyri]